MIALLGRFLMRFSGRTGIGSRCDTEHRSCPLMDHDEQARRPPTLSTPFPTAHPRVTRVLGPLDMQP